MLTEKLKDNKMPHKPRSAVYSQMASRRADSIKDLIENMGPQPLSKVQEAQD